MHLTTHTVLHNLTEGILLVVIVLFFFLGNFRGALIVALTIPFSLLFASICLDLRHIPANLLSLGALDFGMIVEGAVVMVENIVRGDLEHAATESWQPSARQIRAAAHEVQRPVFYAIAHHHHRLPAHLHPAARGRTPVPTHGLDGRFRTARRAVLLHPPRAGAGEPGLPQRRQEWENPVMALAHRASMSRTLTLDHRLATGHARRRLLAILAVSLYLAAGGVIGSEFLPHLDEGAIWARGTLAPSTGPTRRHAHHERGAPRSSLAFPKSRRWSARSAAPTTAPTPPASSTPNTSST